MVALCMVGGFVYDHFCYYCHWQREARQRVQERRWDAAIDAYKLALGDKGLPRTIQPTLLIERGYAAITLHRYDAAMADADEAALLDRSSLGPDLLRSAAYRDRGQPDAAVAAASRAIQKLRCSPSGQQTSCPSPLSDAYAERAAGYTALGQLDKALSDANRAVEIGPTRAWALINRGIVYAALGDPLRAIEDYTKASAQNARDPLPLVLRSEAYFQLERYREALADASKALQLDPGFERAYTARDAAQQHAVFEPQRTPTRRR